MVPAEESGAGERYRSRGFGYLFVIGIDLFLDNWLTTCNSNVNGHFSQSTICSHGRSATVIVRSEGRRSTSILPRRNRNRKIVYDGNACTKSLPFNDHRKSTNNHRHITGANSRFSRAIPLLDNQY